MFGILNLYKPSGPTSRDCVNAIQPYTQPDRVGHGGTLDPLASGVLVLLVGQAVRLTDAVHEMPKEYVGTFQLDCTSDSLDIESPQIPVARTRPIVAEDLIQAIRPLIGTISQIPPVYSAIRVHGKRAHKLARSGKEFHVPSRLVTIDSIELLSFEDPLFRLRIRCGTGTYVRSIGRDIARRVGSDAIMTQLERTRVGPFVSTEAIDLLELDSTDEVVQHLRPARQGVEHWIQRQVSEALITRIHQGKEIDASELQLDPSDAELKNLAILDDELELRALMKPIDATRWRADKGFLVTCNAIDREAT